MCYFQCVFLISKSKILSLFRAKKTDMLDDNNKIESMVEMWLWVTYMLHYLMFIFNKDISIKFNLGKF